MVAKPRRIKWAGYVARIKPMGNANRILVRESVGKTSLRRTSCRWEDNIKMYLKETVCEGVDWIHLAQDRDQWLAVVYTVINLRFP
jgi:hypothetical protein